MALFYCAGVVGLSLFRTHCNRLRLSKKALSMSHPYSPALSLAIDRAVIQAENATGLRRFVWRLWLRWLTRNIP